MSLNDKIMEALCEYMRNHGVNAVEVLEWEDRAEYGGYCETCSYEYIVVDVRYLDPKGRRDTWTYDGPFSELLSEL